MPVPTTIFAPASAIGRAGVTVVRISGPATADACRALTGRPPPPARHATLRAVRDAEGAALDRALLLWFPRPASLTGEDVLEVHVHGGRAVLAGVLEHLTCLPGLAPAEPGGFAKHAFLNGKLDLTAAEGLADLVEAETRAQVRQALRQLDGALGRLYERWRAELLHALALVEAEIDFAAEEHDVAEGALARLRPALAILHAELVEHLADGGRGERLRRGLVVAVLGAPNAGKSSLVNALAGRDVAIVTDVPGTTRDRIELELELAGYPVTLIDTAGLRATVDPVEREGVARAREAAAHADLRLVLFDGATWPELAPDSVEQIDNAALVAVTKADLGRVPRAPAVGGRAALALSVLAPGGLDRLVDALAERARDAMDSSATPLLTRARHRAAVADAEAALRRLLAAPADPEIGLAAEELRHATAALGRITGRVGVEDLLDIVFARFCIGK